MPLSRIRCTLAALVFSAASASLATADPIPVKHTQGALHGFLVVRSEGGAALGYGEITQIANGDRVTDHLVYRFRDGSLDDETTVFTQGKTFQLVSDHHIQRGPFFAKPSEVTIAANGDIATTTPDKDGKPKVETQHIDLPADISNGMIGVLLANVDPNGAPFKLAMVVPSAGKGRLIHLDVSAESQASFTVAGSARKATIYRMKLDLGGVAGVVAPIIGKQPADIVVWVLEGDAPLFVREVGQLSEGGPIVSIEFAGTSFAHQK
jgi:hypothetical protein